LGVAQPNADVVWKLWNQPNVTKCVHAFVETDRIIQTLPWNHRGWHAGGSANNSYIGFEICEPAGHKYASGSTMIGYDVNKNKEYFEKIYNNAVDLCVYLCKEYHINPLTDIICHCEGFKKGIASNHGDVMHWFPKHGKDMDDFRKDVKNKLDKENNVIDQTDETKPITDIKYSYEHYVVKSGDTLSKIAVKYKTTVDSLVKLNNIKNPDSINIGDKLLVATYQLYYVIKGDTLSKIAKNFLDDANRYKEIMELNNLKTTNLEIGQKLRIPNK
jgi:N-acetylmuramoyl-L-alanine amidase